MPAPRADSSATWARSSALVELCNEQGWNIPFPQLAVHKAATAG